MSQTLLSLLKAGPLGELVEGGRVTLELILTLLLNSLITFFVFYTISDFVGAKRRQLTRKHCQEANMMSTTQSSKTVGYLGDKVA